MWVGGWVFPLHTTPNVSYIDQLQMYSVGWDDVRRSLCLTELPICRESNFNEAAQQKTVECTDHAEQAKHIMTASSSWLLPLIYNICVVDICDIKESAPIYIYTWFPDLPSQSLHGAMVWMPLRGL